MSTKKPFRVVVLASTKGTDFGAMLAEQNAGKLKNVEFVGLATNKADCLAVERAKSANVPVFVIHNKLKSEKNTSNKRSDRTSPPSVDDGTIRTTSKSPNFHQELLETVKELEPDMICMVGWMRILKPEFCREFKNKVLNVHPSLLPKYAGGMDTNVHEEVLKNNEKETGMTIHLATEDVDAGPIICQKEIAINENDTPETLKEKVQELEKKWYPEVIRWFRDGKVYFEES